MPVVDAFICDLPIDLAIRLGREPAPISTIRLGSSLKDVEAELIFRTLASVGGNKTRAARILGIARRSIYNLLGRHNMQVATSRLNRKGYRNC